MGAIVGTQEYKEEYIREKVEEWKEDVKAPTSIAKKKPQGAYLAMVFAIQHRWKFIQRTVPEISEYFDELECEIRNTLLPAIIGRGISDLERLQLCRLGWEVWEYQCQIKKVNMNMKHQDK